MRILALLFVFLVGSCKSQKGHTAATEVSEEFQLVLQDAYYPVDERQAFALDNEKELQAFFTKVNRTRKPGLPIPQIDFEQEMALIICAGAQKGNFMPFPKMATTSKEGGNSIHIGLKNQDESPKNDAVTYPLTVFKIPRLERPITYIWDY